MPFYPYCDVKLTSNDVFTIHDDKNMFHLPYDPYKLLIVFIKIGTLIIFR